MVGRNLISKNFQLTKKLCEIWILPIMLHRNEHRIQKDEDNDQPVEGLTFDNMSNLESKKYTRNFAKKS